jgi:hypothetical protein
VLAQQVNLPVEKRNDDIINKIFARLKDSLGQFDGDDKVLEYLIPLTQMLAISEK